MLASIVFVVYLLVRWSVFLEEQWFGKKHKSVALCGFAVHVFESQLRHVALRELVESYAEPGMLEAIVLTAGDGARFVSQDVILDSV